MSGPELESAAFVLGAVDYGDSDRVVTLLTEARGRIPAFAAGARKSRRRFAGALEPFTLLRVRLRERRGELFFLESCTILDAHAGLREDLGRIGHAGHAAELCRELCKDREPHPELFASLGAYLGALARGPARTEDLLAFELAALDGAGLAPRLDACASCGGALSGAVLFDPGHGGALCAGCEGVAFRGAMRLGETTRLALERLQRLGPFGGLELVDPRLRAEARAAVRRFTHELLGHHPRSVAVLEQLGLEG